MAPNTDSHAPPSFHAAVEAAVAEVKAARDTYDWVGIYLLDGDVLTLAEEHFMGAATSETRIPLSAGLCGAAARERRTIVVDDVNADPRHIVCSMTTRSELVVPILAGATVIGVLDVDSDKPAAFTAADRTALEGVAAALARAWARFQRAAVGAD
ncbi:MAG: GAF domain-containing protein [Candidatus Marinimicrobia bacterium]|nr:GAF domain-containing protein [Candidatus Neomarinimicrobiota bacterium]